MINNNLNTSSTDGQYKVIKFNNQSPIKTDSKNDIANELKDKKVKVVHNSNLGKQKRRKGF
jgi:hypothetical protein